MADTPYQHPFARRPQLVPLHDYQRAMANFALERTRAGLFLPIGSGKTLTTLEWLWELDPQHHVLIVGPKPVIRSTWTDEIEKWKFPFRVKSLIQDEKGRKLGPKARHELYWKVCASHESAIWLINRELITDLVNNLPRIKGTKKPYWPFKTVILDEAQAFKSPTSKRFKSMKEVSPQIERLIELTGTPTPNGLEDLWALVYLLDGGQRLGTTITRYRQQFFYSTMQTPYGSPIGWKPRAGADAQIHALVSDITVSLPDMRQNMPPLIMDDHTVQLNEKERALYKEMVKESMLEFTEGDEVVAVNAAVKQAKLSQIASGAVYVNGTNTEYRKIHDRKLEETLRIVEQTDDNVLVAYNFRSDKEMLLEYLRAALDDGYEANSDSDPKSKVRLFDGSAEMVHEWNERKIRVMLAHPASAGAGLNLQQGGHTLVWYTLSWSLENYEQMNGRLFRQGQTETTFIHRLIVEQSVDGRIANALNTKDMSEKALLGAIEATIAETA